MDLGPSHKWRVIRTPPSGAGVSEGGGGGACISGTATGGLQCGCHTTGRGLSEGEAVRILNVLATTTGRRWSNRNGGVKTAAWRTFRRRSTLRHAVKSRRVTVQGPVKKPQTDYMSHRGLHIGGDWNVCNSNAVRNFCAQFVRCFYGFVRVYVGHCLCDLTPMPEDLGTDKSAG